MLKKETPIHKFLFDQSFEPEALAAELSTRREPVFTLTKLEEEKQTSYEKGFQEGYLKSYSEIEEKISNTLDKLQEKINELIEIEKLNRDQVYENTTILTSHILHKVVPTLFNLCQKDEILKFIKSSLSGLKDNPEMQITVHPSMHEDINTIIQKTLSSHHILLTNSTEIGAYDCRIQWINGGKERLLSSFVEKIDQTLDSFLTHLANLYNPTEKITKKKLILENNYER